MKTIRVYSSRDGKFIDAREYLPGVLMIWRRHISDSDSSIVEARSGYRYKRDLTLDTKTHHGFRRI